MTRRTDARAAVGWVLSHAFLLVIPIAHEIMLNIFMFVHAGVTHEYYNLYAPRRPPISLALGFRLLKLDGKDWNVPPDEYQRRRGEPEYEFTILRRPYIVHAFGVDVSLDVFTKRRVLEPVSRSFRRSRNIITNPNLMRRYRQRTGSSAPANDDDDV
jgi:hypothetical protein